METKPTIKFEGIAAFQSDAELPVKTLTAFGHLDSPAFLQAMNDQKIEIPKGYKFEQISRWWVRREGGRLFESYPGQAGAFKTTIALFRKEKKERGPLDPRAVIKK